MTARGVEHGDGVFPTTIVATAKVAGGVWVFASDDGHVARSDTFLGPLRPLGDIPRVVDDTRPARMDDPEALVARDTVGRLARVIDRTLWTTDGTAPLAVAGLPAGSVRGATFVDADRGVALLLDRSVAWTRDGGRTWARVPDSDRAQRVFVRGDTPAFERDGRTFVIDPAGRAVEAIGMVAVDVLPRALRVPLLVRLAADHPGIDFGVRTVVTASGDTLWQIPGDDRVHRVAGNPTGAPPSEAILPRRWVLPGGVASRRGVEVAMTDDDVAVLVRHRRGASLYVYDLGGRARAARALPAVTEGELSEFIDMHIGRSRRRWGVWLGPRWGLAVTFYPAASEALPEVLPGAPEDFPRVCEGAPTDDATWIHAPVPLAAGSVAARGVLEARDGSWCLRAAVAGAGDDISLLSAVEGALEVTRHVPGTITRFACASPNSPYGTPPGRTP